MKKSKKLVATFVAIVVLVVAMMSLTACGGGSEAKTEAKPIASYTSTGNVQFMSAYPEYTYKQATFSVQNLKTFADNTYCLVVTSLSFSGSLSFPDEGDYNATPRGGSVVFYYGTFTSESEDGLNTVVLKTPTRVVYDNQAGATGSTYSVDTANWTNEMGLAVAPPPADGATAVALTATEYLSKVAFKETTIVISEETLNFDYTALTVA